MADISSVSTASKLPSMAGGGGRGGGGANRFGSLARAKDARGTFMRLMRVFLKDGRGVLLAVLITALSGGLDVAVPYFVGRAFDVFDAGREIFSESALLRVLSVIVGLYIGNYLTTTVSNMLMLRVSQRLVSTLRTYFFDKMQRLPLAFYDATSHGDTMSRITNDTDSIASTISSAVPDLVSSLITVIGSLSVMLSLNASLALVTLVSVPLIALVTRIITKRSRKYFTASTRALGRLSGITEESILGMKMVKAFSRQHEERARFNEVNEELYHAAYRAHTWAGFMMPMTNVISNLTFTLVSIAGGLMSTVDVSGGANTALGIVTVGTVVTFLTYSKRFVRPLNNIASMLSSIQQALAGAERVFETLDREEEAQDREDAIELASPRGEVRFEHVRFSYDKRTPVLSDISFDVAPGEVVALVGETGSGKTTIVNLITRYYDADEGQVKIDGVDVRNIRRAGLRSLFSVVLQETCLFSGTVMDNIRYARAEATDEEVISAAKIARADDFIRKLPKGYDTMVSASTDNLSEGQRQLLAIARAVLCPSPILILDEATSSVDTKTEKDIQRALTTLMRGRTSFLIAHRLSTIRDASRIMVLASGKIAEEGNHEALMEKKGLYYEMVVNQTQQ